jgi:hypothetical protein
MFQRIDELSFHLFVDVALNDKRWVALKIIPFQRRRFRIHDQ